MGVVGTVNIGGANFFIFGTTAGADAYFAGSMVYGDAWAALSADNRARALVSGTRILNRIPWAGSRTSPTQPLAFPRTGLSVDGVDIPSTSVPDRIVEANYEIAVRLATGTTSVETSGTTATGVKRIRERVEGAIDTETEWFAPGGGGDTGSRFPEPINSLIAPFLGSLTLGGTVAYGTDGCSTIEGVPYGFTGDGLT